MIVEQSDSFDMMNFHSTMLYEKKLNNDLQPRIFYIAYNHII